MYTTLAKPGKGIFEEKKSEFIGVAIPIKSEEDALALIRKVKAEHYDARHNCYAYVFDGGRVQRYSDDGEPQGTAGIPILDVIRKSGLSDTCIVVTRYFGGILLGAGGLVRAYTAAAKAAVDDAGVASFVPYTELRISLSYSDHQKLLSKLPAFAVKIDNTVYDKEVTLTVALQKTKEDAFLDSLREWFCDRVFAERIGERMDNEE